MHQGVEKYFSRKGTSSTVKVFPRRYSRIPASVVKAKVRVKALEAAAGGESEGGEEAGDEIPEWEPWDGVSGGYKTGDVVRHGGKTWENMLVGMTNVWEPGAPGVDERYWREVAV